MLAVGSRAPFCYGMNEDRTFFSFDTQAGRPAVLVMVGALMPGDTAATIEAVREHAATLAGLEADILLMVDGQSGAALVYSSDAFSGCRPVFCMGNFFQAAGFDGARAGVMVLDRSQRILATRDSCTTAAEAASIVQAVADIPREAPQAVGLPAPVLMIPNLFDAASCSALIAEFEASDHVAGGVASVDATGRPVHKIDDSKKKRNDYVLRPDGATAQQVLGKIAAVCLPELKKAFQFDAAFTDRLLIARYDDTGGYFRRHRDNVAPEVAFRQFALSVNLNADYEGGHLTFPEFNSHVYRPQTGSGIIFSASLLHEAMPVTRGRRYVLLTFFHNQAAQAQRQAA